MPATCYIIIRIVGREAEHYGPFWTKRSAILFALEHDFTRYCISELKPPPIN